MLVKYFWCRSINISNYKTQPEMPNLFKLAAVFGGFLPLWSFISCLQWSCRDWWCSGSEAWLVLTALIVTHIRLGWSWRWTAESSAPFQLSFTPRCGPPVEKGQHMSCHLSTPYAHTHDHLKFHACLTFPVSNEMASMGTGTVTKSLLGPIISDCTSALEPSVAY